MLPSCLEHVDPGESSTLKWKTKKSRQNELKQRIENLPTAWPDSAEDSDPPNFWIRFLLKLNLVMSGAVARRDSSSSVKILFRGLALLEVEAEAEGVQTNFGGGAISIKKIQNFFNIHFFHWFPPKFSVPPKNSSKWMEFCTVSLQCQHCLTNFFELFTDNPDLHFSTMLTLMQSQLIFAATYVMQLLLLSDRGRFFCLLLRAPSIQNMD